MKRFQKIFLVAIIFSMVSVQGVSVSSAENLEIIHEKGLLTVSAEDALPENIFLELGKTCNINIIAHGNVFPDKGVTLNIKDKPIKDAVKRLVKACALQNYLMDFKKDAQGKSRLVKIDLYMGGSGQRVLVKGKEETAKKEYRKDREVPDKQQKNKRPRKSSFEKDTDFSWDGSAPIAFPEFKGEIAYDKSEFGWDDNAKSFSEKTMDMVPPAVRGVVSEQIIKMSDQIAKEKGVDTITPDITAEAVGRIGQQSNLPPQVMDLMPKKQEDFDKPKVPIDSDHLKEEFRE